MQACRIPLVRGMAGVLKVPVGAWEVPARARTLLLTLQRVSRNCKEAVTVSWYAEIMDEWERTGECWTNVRVVKITTDDETLLDVEQIEPQVRGRTPHEDSQRLKVSFPRKSGQWEYLHRIVAFAFPPPGRPGFRERFPPGTFDEFRAARYQADHLVDADLLARPSLAIAGWLEPLLPEEHAARERARRHMRAARSRARSVLYRLARGPVALRFLETEAARGRLGRRTGKQRRNLQDLQQQSKQLRTALSESRALLAKSYQLPTPSPAPFTSWDACDEPTFWADVDETDYGKKLFVEFDRELRSQAPRVAALYGHCWRSDLAKVGRVVGLADQ